MDAQLAPVLSFNEFEQADQKFIVAGGNFYNVMPYEGRYDAQPLVLLTCEKDQIKYVHQTNLLGISGQVRDLKWIKGKQHRSLVAARNNDRLVFMQLKNSLGITKDIVRSGK
jgi:hypothetical protein